MKKSKFNLLYEEIMKNYTVNEARELALYQKPLKVAEIWKQNLIDIFNDKFSNLKVNVYFDDRRNRRDNTKTNHWLIFDLYFSLTPDIIGQISIEISPFQGNVYNNKTVIIVFNKLIKTEDKSDYIPTKQERITLELSKRRDYMDASEFPTPELISEIQSIYQKMYEE